MTPMIPPANRYDPMARQPTPRSTGVVPSFMPSSIDQALIQQGMSSPQMPKRVGGGQDMSTPFDHYNQYREMQARMSGAQPPAQQAQTQPQPQAPTPPNLPPKAPMAYPMGMPFMGAFESAMNANLAQPAPRGLLDMAPTTPAAGNLPQAGQTSSMDQRYAQLMQMLGLLR